MVELNGTSAGAGANGLFIGQGAAGSTIKGLVINRFSGHGIVVDADGATITGNYIGTNVAGTVDQGNTQNGILLLSDGNTIQNNVISGNDANGIGTSVSTASYISQWRAEGNTTDDQGGNTATWVTTPSYATGINGQAFSLNGSGDYLTVADDVTLQTPQVTVEAWVNAETLANGNYHAVVTRGNSGTGPLADSRNSFFLGFADNALLFETTHVDGTTVFLYGPTVSTGTWHHIAGSYDGTTVRLYLDGAEVASQVVSSGSPIEYDPGVPVLIGTDMNNRFPTQDFVFDVFYEDDRTDGSLKRYIPEPAYEMPFVPLLQLFNLDRLNRAGDPQPDGYFDYIQDVTVIERTGSIVFPVLEPFGSHLDTVAVKKVRKTSTVTNAVLEKYRFDLLYDTSYVAATQLGLTKNKFRMVGKVKGAAANGEIYLGSFIPQGSVRVNVGGKQLVEGQDYEIDYSLGRLRIINPAFLAQGTPLNVSFEDNSIFSLQQKNMLGLRAEYQFK